MPRGDDQGANPATILALGIYGPISRLRLGHEIKGLTRCHQSSHCAGSPAHLVHRRYAPSLVHPLWHRLPAGHGREAGLETRMCEIHSDGRELAYLGTKSILSRGEPLTAVFAGSDHVAAGVYATTSPASSLALSKPAPRGGATAQRNVRPTVNPSPAFAANKVRKNFLPCGLRWLKRQRYHRRFISVRAIATSPLPLPADATRPPGFPT